MFLALRMFLAIATLATCCYVEIKVHNNSLSRMTTNYVEVIWDNFMFYYFLHLDNATNKNNQLLIGLCEPLGGMAQL